MRMSKVPVYLYGVLKQRIGRGYGPGSHKCIAVGDRPSETTLSTDTVGKCCDVTGDFLDSQLSQYPDVFCVLFLVFCLGTERPTVSSMVLACVSTAYH